MTRSGRRTAALMGGTILALVTVLASVGMMTSMQHALDVQFGTIERSDASVFSAPGADTTKQLATLPGVVAAEPTTQAAVSVAAHNHTYRTDLTGLEPDTTMHGFGDETLPASGLLAGRPLADELGIAIGDTVTVTADGRAPRQLPIAGFVDEPLGTQLYATNDVVRSLTTARLDGTLLRFAAGADRDEIRSAATAVPGVLVYTDTDSVRDEFDNFLALFWVFVGAMLVLGAILAFAVIYVTMTVTLAERSTELATFRAVGVPIRRLTAMLAAENLIATAAALPLGIAAGFGAAWAFLRSFDSDLFTLDLSLGWLAPTLAAAAVLLAAALSQIPAIRIVQGIDIAHVVRERA